MSGDGPSYEKDNDMTIIIKIILLKDIFSRRKHLKIQPDKTSFMSFVY